MKIVCTIHDAAMAANVGGSVESISVVLDIPVVPTILKQFFVNREILTATKGHDYTAISFSLLADDESLPISLPNHRQ